MVSPDQINLHNMTIADLEDLEKKIQIAKAIPTGKKVVALISALKETVAAIRKIDETILGETIGAVSPQAMPKEATTGRKYGLSETEVSNAKEKGAKAIAAL